jgi:hypothetical protein
MKFTKPEALVIFLMIAVWVMFCLFVARLPNGR